MANENYQEIQRLRNEIRQYSLLGITVIDMYKLVKYNPQARREFSEQVKFALEKLAMENPRLEVKVPVRFQPERQTQIPIQSSEKYLNQ